MEGTAETASPLEGDGFELPVPSVWSRLKHDVSERFAARKTIEIGGHRAHDNFRSGSVIRRGLGARRAQFPRNVVR
jgi:hypothetical protein